VSRLADFEGSRKVGARKPNRAMTDNTLEIPDTSLAVGSATFSVAVFSNLSRLASSHDPG
jgi:hypothetical protein